MLLCAHYILPITSSSFEDGAILVRDNRICDLGSAAMLKLRYPDEEVLDYGNAALMPGLIDLDANLESAVMRGSVHDVPFVAWSSQMTKNASKLEAADWNDSALFGGLEAIASGITCLADITYAGASWKAVNKLGLRGVVYRRVAAKDKRRIDYAMRNAANDIARWRECADSDRVTAGIAPAPTYICHPLVYARVTELALAEDLPVAMHLAGSHEEYNFVRYGSDALSLHQMEDRIGYVEIPPWMPAGCSPVRYALNWDAFEVPNIMAIHCIHVDEEDIKKLKEYDVSVAVCPRSAAQLGMGVTPMSELKRAGIRFGFGSAASTALSSADLIGEVRFATLIQRSVNVGDFVKAEDMLAQATIGAAQALRMDDIIGSIEVGKRADIIAVDLSGAGQSSNLNPMQAIVNTCNGSDVLMTMVDGKKLYEKNHWEVDVEVARVIARIIEIRSKLRM